MHIQYTRYLYQIKEGEKTAMITKTIPSKRVVELIKNTTTYNCDWINLSTFKEYLLQKELSLKDVSVLHAFLVHLQNERFIFECKDTYITYFQEEIFILSKSKYSFDYRLDCYELTANTLNWEEIRTSISLLLRLRNAIVITNSNDDCDALFESISLQSFA